jgi:KaiC/GvpD/RAD55 family RecA-like ATPase
MTMSKIYDVGIQRFFLEMMITDPQAFVRIQNIYNAENFDRSLRSAAAFLREHGEKYSTMPTLEQINAVTSADLQAVPNITEDHVAWFMDEFEGFTKQKELERAILKAADMLEKGEFDPVEKLIKDAVQISLTKDLGTDYFADPRSRLSKLKDNNGQVSTGWPALDRRLFGGFNKGELNIFAGGSGSGKSLFMQNIAVNWMLAGLNGCYITLELSEELTAMRIDGMLTNVPAREIFKNLDDVELKVKMMGKKSGGLQIKYMPAQSNVNDLRAYLKELQIKSGRKVEFLMVDYLDLLMPVSAKVSPSDLFVKDKYVSEELRNLAKELDILFVTASQLNRSAVEEVEFDHSHISGGISKVNTADNLIGIFTSRSMREHGRYQIQLMKTRSSSGVGQKVDLEFDVDSLRIRDLAEDEDYKQFKKQSSSIYDSIKRGSTVSPGSASGESSAVTPDQPGKIVADVNSSKLKQMLAQIKTKS